MKMNFSDHRGYPFSVAAKPFSAPSLTLSYLQRISSLWKSSLFIPTFLNQPEDCHRHKVSLRLRIKSNLDTSQVPLPRLPSRDHGNPHTSVWHWTKHWARQPRVFRPDFTSFTCSIANFANDRLQLTEDTLRIRPGIPQQTPFRPAKGRV